MLKKSFVHYLAKTLVDVMFYVGIVSCLLVPLLVKGVKAYFSYGDDVVTPFMLILFSSGACSVYILFQLKRMFHSLMNDNPFIEANVSCFRKMAVASFLIALIYIAKCIWWFTLTTGVIIIVFAIAGLFCLTLKDVFKQAVAYKEENDLTV